MNSCFSLVCRLAELSYEKGDKVEAATKIDDLLAIIEKRKLQKNQFDLLYLLRAYLIAAKVKSGGASFFMLLKALNYAIRFGYPRFRALILLELARLQVIIMHLHAHASRFRLFMANHLYY